jgi:hypothetical protein
MFAAVAVSGMVAGGLGMFLLFRHHPTGKAAAITQQSPRVDPTAEQVKLEESPQRKQLIDATAAAEKTLAAIQAQLRTAESSRKAIAAERLKLLKLERQRLDGIIAAEKERVRAIRAAFGQMSQADQVRAARLAEAANSRQLSRTELQFLEQVAGAEALVNQQYEKRVNQSAYASLPIAQSLARRLQEAEAVQAAVDKEIERLKQLVLQFGRELKQGRNP